MPRKIIEHQGQTFTYNPMNKIIRYSNNTVYKGKNEDTKKPNTISVYGIEATMKCMFYKIDYFEKLIEVLEIFKKAENPYILRYTDHFRSSQNYYILTESVDGGTLQDLYNKNLKLDKSKRMHTSQIIKIIYQISSALSTFADSNIIHRNIKPASIFINEGIRDTYKVGNMSIAEKVTYEFSEKFGSEAYWSPEFYTGKSKTSKVDIFAQGVIQYQLLFWDYPFDLNNQKTSVLNADNLILPEKIDTEVEHLLRGMLKVDFEDRYSAADIKNHKVFDFCKHEFE